MDHGPVDRLDPHRFPTRPTTSVHVEPLLASVQQYRLAEHDPHIAQHCQTIERRPGTPAAHRAAQHLAALVQPRSAFHRDHPFPVPLPTELTGAFTIGTVTVTGRPAGLTVPQLLGQGILTGRSGAGKTTAIRHLVHACNARKTILDWKNDFDSLLTDERFLLIDQTTPWNPRTPPPWLSPAAYQHVFTEHYLAANYAAVHQRDIFTHRWHETNHPSATIADLIAPPPTGRSTFQEIDARRNHNARIERFAPWALSTTPSGITWEDLLAYNILVRVDDLDDVARFLWSLLVNVTYLKNRREQRRDHLTDLLINDEAYDLYPREQRGITTDPLLGEKQRWREYGIASVTSTTSYRTLHPLSTASMGWLLALAPGNAEEAHAISRSLDLNEHQTHAFMRLGTGQGLLRTNDVPYPTHITLAPFPTTKSITPAALNAARDRVAALARRHQPEHTKLLAARAESETNPHPTPSQTAAPSSSPPSRVAPVVETSPNTRKVALNEHATALLHDVADHQLTLTTLSYRRCNLRLSEGDRARTLLTNIGFLESHRVRTGAGRGKTGSALRLTPAGWQWLGRTPSKGTRGGDSVQHAFFVHELARRIPHSTIETLSVDLVIPYNAADHANLLDAVQALGARTIALNNGDLIACEIECSRPETTGVRSAQRDIGFSLTVLAVFGNAERLRDRIAPSDRLVIVDVLQLLDALRRVNA